VHNSLTIYILLPVHNRKNVTQKFISCLKQQNYQNYHLIVIDDGSTDGTEDMIRGEINELTVIKGTGNWWWAGCLQRGYQWLINNDISLNNLVLIINDDVQFDNFFLQQAVYLMGDQKKRLLLAQCYSLQTQELLGIGVYVNWQRLEFRPASSQEEINCLSTRGLFLRIEDFAEIGGFYPCILPHYTSDYEFTMRAHRKGYQLTSDISLKVWVDQTQTGYHQFQESKINIKKLLSIKSSENPIYFSIFIILACPMKWKILNLCRTWWGFIRYLLKKFGLMKLKQAIIKFRNLK